jgi:hypothetical protein
MGRPRSAGRQQRLLAGLRGSIHRPTWGERPDVSRITCVRCDRRRSGNERQLCRKPHRRDEIRQWAGRDASLGKGVGGGTEAWGGPYLELLPNLLPRILRLNLLQVIARYCAPFQRSLLRGERQAVDHRRSKPARLSISPASSPGQRGCARCEEVKWGQVIVVSQRRRTSESAARREKRNSRWGSRSSKGGAATLFHTAGVEPALLAPGRRP